MYMHIYCCLNIMQEVVLNWQFVLEIMVYLFEKNGRYTLIDSLNCIQMTGCACNTVEEEEGYVAKAKTSSDSSVGDAKVPQEKLWFCGLRAFVKVSRTPKNPRKMFVGCPLYKMGGGCNYFDWVDHPCLKCPRKNLIIKILCVALGGMAVLWLALYSHRKDVALLGY